MDSREANHPDSSDTPPTPGFVSEDFQPPEFGPGAPPRSVQPASPTESASSTELASPDAASRDVSPTTAVPSPAPSHPSASPYQPPVAGQAVPAAPIPPGRWGAILTLVTTAAVVLSSGALFLLTSGVVLVLATVVVMGEFNLATFQDPAQMKRVISSRVGFPMLVVIPQLALILPAVAAAMLSRRSVRESLGLVRGHWPIWAWVAAAFAAPLVGMVSGLICSVFLEESDQLKEMSQIFRRHGAAGFLIPLALLIGVTPAVCEELLFRGYVQRRLTSTLGTLFGKPTAPVLGPLLGILAASVLFAVFHWDPVHVVAVFPIGLYLGWVSWRSGSLFPAMMGHLINNVISVVAVVMTPENQADTLALPSAMFVLFILGTGGIGLIAMLVASVFYGRPERPELRAA